MIFAAPGETSTSSEATLSITDNNIAILDGRHFRLALVYRRMLPFPAEHAEILFHRCCVSSQPPYRLGRSGIDALEAHSRSRQDLTELEFCREPTRSE